MLTDEILKDLKKREKMYKVFDEHGLYIQVMPNGSKRWRFKYHFGKKEKLMSLGVYPLVSLERARRRRDQQLAIISNGIDPSHVRVDKFLTNKYEKYQREIHTLESSITTINFKIEALKVQKRNIEQRIRQKVASMNPLYNPHQIKAILSESLDFAGTIENLHGETGISLSKLQAWYENGIPTSMRSFNNLVTWLEWKKSKKKSKGKKDE